MNENHKRCGSDEWKAVVRDSILPWALGDVDLGDEVLEVGPGYGATTEVLGESVSKLTAVEIDDSLASPELEAHHEGDTYNPVDPEGLAKRLEAAGFAEVEVKTNPFGWAALARRP